MYLALYRKWRPRTFDDVVGQTHITNTLKNQIILGKTAHAYLFTGTRGTGKTTCARILAMALNCTDIKEGNPCLICDSCKSIMAGNNMDVEEIDAASNNRVDNVRQLREDAIYSPATSRYRIFIIDETHMLTNEAFNALLKIMEEPPEHVKFILATTEAHKVPATILSRCQRFDFMRIGVGDIARLLTYVANEEGITITEPAVQLIAKLADGAMRDGYSILDQCIATSKEIDTNTVVEAVGITSREYLISMTDCIINRDTAGAVAILCTLYQGSKDMVSFCEELILHFRNIMLAKTGDQTDELINVLPDELLVIKEYAAKLPMSQVIEYISSLQVTLDNMNRYSDKRLNMEIGLVKLTDREDTLPASGVTHTSGVTSFEGMNKELLRRIERLEQAINSVTNTTAVGIVSQTSKTTAEPADTVIEAMQGRAVKGYSGTTATVANAPTHERSDVNLPSTTPKRQDGVTEDTVMPLFSRWDEVLAQLSVRDSFIHSLVHNAVVYEHEGFLYIQSPMFNISQLLKKDGNISRFLGVIEEVTSTKYRLRIKKNRTQDFKKTDPLDDLAKKASQAGISVEM